MSTPTESTPTSPTVEELIAYVRADKDRDRAFCEQCRDRAGELVGKRVGTATVPDSVLSAAVLEVAANLWQRRVQRNGTPSFNEPELMAGPHRPALDPMTPAWPLLRPYLGPGLA